MIFQDDETNRIIGLVRSGAKAFTANELKQIIAASEKKKPIGFDAHMATMQRRYAGKQRALVADRIAKRYPNAPVPMPIAPVNFLRTIAQNEAGVYVRPPTRWLETPDGKQLDETDARSQMFSNLCRNSLIGTRMREVERRTIVVNNAIVHCGWDATGSIAGRLQMTLYWPHHIQMICHDSRPNDPDAAIIFAVQQGIGSQGDDDDRWFWVWSREFTEYDDGDVNEFGPWFSCMLSTSGKQRGSDSEPRQYEGTRLPFAIAQIGEREGFWVVDEDRDLGDVVDELNVMRSNELHVLNMQGHDQVAYSGAMDAATIALGPDRLMKLLPGETMTSITHNPKFEDMREGRSLSLRELAISRSQNPAAYSASIQAPESGIAKRISNIQHDQRLDELRIVFQDFEESQLLPIMIDVHDTFSPNTIGDGVVPRVAMNKEEEYEDNESRQRRAQSAMDAGLISPARAAVEAGFYDSINDAVNAGLSDAIVPPLQERPTGGTATGNVASALLETE